MSMCVCVEQVFAGTQSIYYLIFFPRLDIKGKTTQNIINIEFVISIPYWNSAIFIRWLLLLFFFLMLLKHNQLETTKGIDMYFVKLRQKQNLTRAFMTNMNEVIRSLDAHNGAHKYGVPWINNSW